MTIEDHTRTSAAGPENDDVSLRHADVRARKSVIDGLEHTRTAIWKVDSILALLGKMDGVEIDSIAGSIIVSNLADTMRDLLGGACESIDNARIMLEHNPAGAVESGAVDPGAAAEILARNDGKAADNAGSDEPEGGALADSLDDVSAELESLQLVASLGVNQVSSEQQSVGIFDLLSRECERIGDQVSYLAAALRARDEIADGPTN